MVTIRARLFALVGSIFAVGPLASSAQSVPLTDLLQPGASLQSGDKRFDQFTYVATGDMPAAADVSVVGITDSSGNFEFRLDGPFQDFVGGGSSLARITYRVSVTDPGRLIIDAHLAGDPFVVADFRDGSAAEASR